MMTKTEYAKKIEGLRASMTEIQIGEMGGFITYEEYVKTVLKDNDEDPKTVRDLQSAIYYDALVKTCY